MLLRYLLLFDGLCVLVAIISAIVLYPDNLKVTDWFTDRRVEQYFVNVYAVFLFNVLLFFIYFITHPRRFFSVLKSLVFGFADLVETALLSTNRKPFTSLPLTSLNIPSPPTKPDFDPSDILGPEK